MVAAPVAKAIFWQSLANSLLLATGGGSKV